MCILVNKNVWGGMNLGKNESGNVALMFALALLPMLMLATIAIEFSRQQGNERQAQAALDATVLAVAQRRALEGGDENSLTAFAQTYFTANLPDTPGATYDPLQLTITRDDEILLSVDASMPSGMLSLLGADSLDFSVQVGAVATSLSPLELVLVADVSNSMTGARIEALRDAAHLMVDQLIAPDGDNIRIAIVPFNNYVNVGIANRNAGWISVPDDEVREQNRCVRDFDASEALGCTFTTVCDVDASSGGGQEGCFMASSCPASVDVVTTCEIEEQDFVWLGCVGSRERPLNLQDQDFASDPALGVLMRPFRNCEEENAVLELTSDETEIRAKIDALIPSGTTYMAPGITWGIRTLSSGAPFDTAALSGAIDGQAIVLLSDGANIRTRNVDDERHDRNNPDEADEDTLAACDAAKAAGIIVYTVDFGVDDPDTENLLRDCATSPDNVFEADSPNQLSAVFENISQNFKEIALSR